ncbi:type II secretion system protein N [Pseudohalioglobus lutimaris]|uniref:Type II secretion system protein N n=1 Tax=Pseudohalioglobus lutimaris TaxID=1737061 RepID=A0A2N5X775_9GAMM|nr:type II secretion system protein N [Pseudohalioglobus lutimaris]PLW70330.1 type II secretion system protein N [Pseudohalioglobus lutimaris]
MRARWLTGACLCLCFVALLLAAAPARLLFHLVPPERVVLQGVSGTLWRGQAARALIATGDDWLHLGSLSWQLSPISLALFSPTVTLDSQWGRQRFNAQVTYHSERDMELEALDAVFDAGLLRRYLPVALLGSVGLQFERLVIREGLPEEAQGRVVWEEGAWRSPQGRRSLGSYVLDVSAAGPGVINGEVITLAGDVKASGPVVLRQADYEFDVLISGPGLSDPQLRQAIQLVASPEGDAYRIKLEGTL